MFFLCFYRLSAAVWRGWPNERNRPQNWQKPSIYFTSKIGQKTGSFEVENGKKRERSGGGNLTFGESLQHKKRGKVTPFWGKIGEEKRKNFEKKRGDSRQFHTVFRG